MRRRSLLVAAGATLAGCTGSSGDGGSPTPTTTPPTSDLSLTSPAFEAGGTIPQEHTCDGADVSPALQIDGVPDGAEAFALVMDDPDAPRDEPFVHWLLWNLPGDRRELPEDVPAKKDALDSRQGTNSFGDIGYGGPCPPEGDGPHTYRFHLFALDSTLDVEAGAKRDALESAVEGKVVAEALLKGEYERG